MTPPTAAPEGHPEDCADLDCIYCEYVQHIKDDIAHAVEVIERYHDLVQADPVPAKPAQVDPEEEDE